MALLQPVSVYFSFSSSLYIMRCSATLCICGLDISVAANLFGPTAERSDRKLKRLPLIHPTTWDVCWRKNVRNALMLLLLCKLVPSLRKLFSEAEKSVLHFPLFYSYSFSRRCFHWGFTHNPWGVVSEFDWQRKAQLTATGRKSEIPTCPVRYKRRCRHECCFSAFLFFL